MPTSLRIHRQVLHRRAVRGADPPPDRLVGGFVDALRGVDPVDADGVWLIRRLEVHAAVGAGTDGPAAGRVLARALVRALDRTLAAGPRPSDVLWFPDRAALLAQWLVDVAHDRAAGRWEYRELGPETGPTAVRERAEEEPETVLAALRVLPPGDVDAVLRCLAPSDAGAVVLSVCPPGPSAQPVGELAAVVRELADAGRLPDDPRRATLATVVAATAPPTATLAQRARGLVLVALALRGCAWVDRDRFAHAVTRGAWLDVVRLAGAGAAADVAAALAAWPADDRAVAVQVLGGRRSGSPDPGADRSPARHHTRLGGLFLLLPLLAELPLARCASAAAWPPLHGARPDALLALLSILGVLGPDRAPAGLADPWLRLALGLPELDPADLQGWSRTLDPARLPELTCALCPVTAGRAEAVRTDLADPGLRLTGLLAEPVADAVQAASSALLRELAGRLPGMATASAGHLRRNVLALDAHVQAEEDRIVVELGRPPLDLLLSLTGMNRRSFLLEATGTRTWMLTRAR